LFRPRDCSDLRQAALPGGRLLAREVGTTRCSADASRTRVPEERSRTRPCRGRLLKPLGVARLDSWLLTQSRASGWNIGYRSVDQPSTSSDCSDIVAADLVAWQAERGAGRNNRNLGTIGDLLVTGSGRRLSQNAVTPLAGTCPPTPVERHACWPGPRRTHATVGWVRSAQRRGVTYGFAFTLTPCLTWPDGGYLGGWGELQAKIGGCCEAEPLGEVAVGRARAGWCGSGGGATHGPPAPAAEARGWKAEGDASSGWQTGRGDACDGVR
jgi:hypothetical protein